MGRADYDIDGFLPRPGEVVGSGEIRMSPEALNNAFGRQALRLTTDDGRVLEVRFSGKRLDPASDAAHADITGQLPGPSECRRQSPRRFRLGRGDRPARRAAPQPQRARLQ